MSIRYILNLLVKEITLIFMGIYPFMLLIGIFCLVFNSIIMLTKRLFRLVDEGPFCV
jgi:uncharacterized membrane protein YvlD (DUF360 family)